MGGGRYVTVVRKSLILIVDKEDVLGFKIGMNEIEVMEN